MTPALRSGDQLVVRWLRGPGRTRPGTVVVVELPDGVKAVKRLVRHEPDGRVWVEGDNPFGSTDSRSLGPLPATAVVGRALIRVWPRPCVVPRAHGDVVPRAHGDVVPRAHGDGGFAGKED